MPTRPHTICPHCRTPNTTGSGCPTCAARRAARRPIFDYSSPGWATRSREFLARRRWCQLCGVRAQVADHFPTSRRDLVLRGVRDPDADRFLRPLCASCHGRETAKRQPGGWHQPE